jgi:hypothetical protein
LLAYGGLYSDTAQTITIGVGGGVEQIDLGNGMPFDNVTLGTNTITIWKAAFTKSTIC